MRILHVTPTYVPAWRYGGPIVAVHGLCRALARRGHDVEVFTTNVDGDGELDAPILTPTSLDGVKVTYFECNGPRRIYWSQSLSQALSTKLDRFDVVHAHACFLMPPTQAARKSSQFCIPYIFSPRGMLVPELITGRNAWLKQCWISVYGRSTLRGAAAVHVTSEREAADLRRVVGETNNVEVVANGVDIEETSIESPRQDRPYRILFLGRISWKKGLDVLIRALRDMPAVQLRVVGNDEEGLRPSLETLAREQGVAQRIDWLGPLYGDDKLREFALSDVFALPSLSENFGNTVLEAMAAGVPIVCTPEVGASSLVNETQCGLVVERGPQAFAAALNGLLNDPNRRSAMGTAGKLAARAHSWDAKAAEMEALYTRCLGKSVREAHA